jgi:tetratricopeptide (TPR) repeat protein
MDVLENYYDLFGLEQGCSLDEIKSSFRDRVKKLHPDVSRDSEGSEKLRHLLVAYRVLCDSEKRADYDRCLLFSRQTDSFVYRDFLKQRRDDNTSQAKLIFYDLLHDNGEDALELYETLLLHDEFSLEFFMDREDFMDCAFLLAEEYEKRVRFDKAFDLLTAIVRLERQKPYFRHFFEEVVIRLRSLANRKLGKVLGPRELLEKFFTLAEMMPPGEKKIYAKKIAEIYVMLGREDLADDYFKESAKAAGKTKNAAQKTVILF